MAADFLRVRLWREIHFRFPSLSSCSRNVLPPWQAAAVAFLGSMDVQEIRRGVPFSRMVFNRSEIGLSVMAASAWFHALVGDSVELALGTCAVARRSRYFAAVNAALVAWPVAKIHAVSTGDSCGECSVRRYGRAMLRYVGVGLMAPLIAVVWLTAGGIRAGGISSSPLGLAWASYSRRTATAAAGQIETKNESLIRRTTESVARKARRTSRPCGRTARFIASRVVQSPAYGASDEARPCAEEVARS